MPAQGGFVTRAAEHHLDAVVIGAGVIGLAVGWRAAARGLRVAVVEREEPGAGASHVAAGMLAPVSEAQFGEGDLLELGLRSARGWPDFAAELQRASGADPGYRPCGTLLVARDSDEAEALERLLEFRRALGLRVDRLRPSAARALEPALAPTLRLAVHAPDDHAADPRALTWTLVAALRRAGAELRTGADVRAVRTGGERVEGVELATGEFLAARQVVVAAGCWAGAIDGIPAQARVPVRPVKGQILRLRDPAGSGLATRVLRIPDAYLVPRGDGRYVLGATVEERGFDTAVTAGALLELLREMTDLLPGLGELELEEAGAGLRPATPDNAPAIGAGALDGLVWATGHHRNGILLAPVTADLVAGVLSGDGLPDFAAPFAPARFEAARPVEVV
jgi:glycine oxidase